MSKNSTKKIRKRKSQSKLLSFLVKRKKGDIERDLIDNINALKNEARIEANGVFPIFRSKKIDDVRKRNTTKPQQLKSREKDLEIELKQKEFTTGTNDPYDTVKVIQSIWKQVQNLRKCFNKSNDFP